MPDNNYPTPEITAAYVWQVASDFRASNAIADKTHIGASDHHISLGVYTADLASMAAIVDMLDTFRVQSHDYDDTEPGMVLVIVFGQYRGVRVNAQTSFPKGRSESVLAALAADRVEVSS